MIEGGSFYRTHDLEHKPQCLAHARCNAFPILLNTPPNSKNTLDPILPKLPLPFKTYSDLGGRGVRVEVEGLG